MIQKQRHKYGVVPVLRKGLRYDSKLEAKCAAWLDLLVKAEEVVFYLRQIPFDLPGKVKYRCDFQIFWKSGKVSFLDAKGIETKDFIMKKKMVEALFPVEIELWKGKK